MRTFILILTVLGAAQAPLHAQPDITNQPAGQTIWAGVNVTFAVGVSDAGPLTYQWQFNTTNLPGIITTVAGTTNKIGYSGDGGAATNARLAAPSGVAVDACGNLFIADTANKRIREVNTNGIIFTVAGTNNAGFSGDGGPATTAKLNSPNGLAVDSYGNLFIADFGNNRIREVNTNGIITTVVGGGSGGGTDGLGDGGMATNAILNHPSGVAVDTSGDLFIADNGNAYIREVNTNGIITTVAGYGPGGGTDGLGDGNAATNAILNSPSGVAVDSYGNLFIADTSNSRIREVNTNGIITTVAGGGSGGGTDGLGDGGAATNAILYAPSGVTLDAYGNLFIADESGSRIREVNANGVITTVAGKGTSAFAGDGGAATNASLNTPFGVTVDGFGNLFIADTSNSRIRKVTNTQWPLLVLNNVTSANAGKYQLVVTGPDGSLTSNVANLAVGTIISQPVSCAKLAGDMATFSITVGGMTSLSYQWLKSGLILTDGDNVSGSTTNTLTLSDVQNADTAAYTVLVSNNIAGSVTSSPAFLEIDAVQPTNQTVWARGNVRFALTTPGSGPFTYQWQLNGTNLPNGIITTVAGGGAGGGTDGLGDAGPAANSILVNPFGVALDPAGDLFIADTFDSRIREVDTNGIITTVAGGNTNYPYSDFGDGGPATNASLFWPHAVALDLSGKLFIADYANNRIREVNTNGIITTVAGDGPSDVEGSYSGDGDAATNASLNEPYGLAVDASDDVFIADTVNERIREVNSNGIITTVAGNGNIFDSGDGGPATNASVHFPEGAALDAGGDLFIADNSRIREINTNGIISTVAGGGLGGGTDGKGDGGAAINATFNVPCGVTLDAFGDLFIPDSLYNTTFGNKGDDLIREVNTNGIITVVAGNGTFAFSGDGGPATNASLFAPQSVAVDSSGDLFIADTYNSRIRKVTNTQGPSLVLNNVSGVSAGNYQLVITGPSGSVTSSVISLTVILPPTNFIANTSISGLRVQLNGTPDYPYILQWTTNLTPPVNWQPILTNSTDGNGNWNWTNSNLSGHPANFYRAVVQ